MGWDFDDGLMSDFLNDKIDFMHMRPLFDKNFVSAIRILKEIDKAKTEDTRERKQRQFSYLLNKIREKTEKNEHI